MNVPTKLLGLGGVLAVLKRVLIAFGRAGSFRASMHSASVLSADRRCLARRALAGFSAATRAVLHRLGVALMRATHERFPRLALAFFGRSNGTLSSG